MLLWSLLSLCDGTFPEFDWNGDTFADPDHVARAGSRLAGGLFCVIWNVKGDMDFLANAFHLEHFAGKLLCPWCRANRSEGEEYYAAHNHPHAPWTDIRPEATWRRRQV